MSGYAYAENVQRLILVSNCVLEIASAVFDRLSSVHKPYYAFFSMILSFILTLMGVLDLAQKGRREGVNWVWKRGQIPWFYSDKEKPLGTMVDIIGLVCGIFQLVFATITCTFLSLHINDPIKISSGPFIFAFVVMCSGFQTRNDKLSLPVFEPRDLGITENSPQENHPSSPENICTEMLTIHPHRSPESFFHPPVRTNIYLPAEETWFWPENDDEPFWGSFQLLNLQRLPVVIKIPVKISSLECFQARNIHSLHVQGCRDFTHLPESLYALQNLRYMNIEYCPDLSYPPRDCSTHDCLDLLCFENCPNMFYPKQITLHQSETGGLKTTYSNGMNSIVICKPHVLLSTSHCFRQQTCKLEEISTME